MENNNFEQFLSLFSVILGYENLIENREQSRQNDVQSANDKQAKYLLEELSKKFDEQKLLLKEIKESLENLKIKRGDEC